MYINPMTAVGLLDTLHILENYNFFKLQEEQDYFTSKISLNGNRLISRELEDGGWVKRGLKKQGSSDIYSIALDINHLCETQEPTIKAANTEGFIRNGYRRKTEENRAS